MAANIIILIAAIAAIVLVVYVANQKFPTEGDFEYWDEAENKKCYPKDDKWPPDP